MIGTGNYDEEDSALVEFIDPTYEADPTDGMNTTTETAQPEVDEFEEVKAP
jgi:hypothetical protein